MPIVLGHCIDMTQCCSLRLFFVVVQVVMESLIQYAKKPSLLSTKPTDLQKIDFYQYIFTISTLFLSVFRTKYVHKMKEMFFTVLCK